MNQQFFYKRGSWYFVMLICCMLLLAACGQKSEENPVTAAPTNSGQEASGQDTTNQNSETPTDAPTETPTVSPTPTIDPHAGEIRSPLTNEWISEEFENRRPIAVMMNNVKKAVPQTGISQAGVVYECMVEGATRLMSVIEDYENLEKIGSVRSCRKYYVAWALEWDAIYLHYGGPKKYVKTTLDRKDVHNLDGIYLEGLVFYRTKDRVAPHNAYASGQGVLKGAEKKGYSLTHTANYTGSHYQFADEDAPVVLSEGMSAVHVEPGYTTNKPWFEYNAADGLYYRYQYGAAQIDDLNGEQLAYRNILIQFTKCKTLDHNGYLEFTTHDSGMGGYYITGGKAIPITWEKKSDFEPTRYYDAQGNEIVLNTGKTWVCVVQSKQENKVVIR